MQKKHLTYVAHFHTSFPFFEKNRPEDANCPDAQCKVDTQRRKASNADVVVATCARRNFKPPSQYTVPTGLVRLPDYPGAYALGKIGRPFGAGTNGRCEA